MSTADLACPEKENSTDCLVRALIQLISNQTAAEDEKYDWDPITFVFTVPVGILAAVFALVTILQAVLVTGAGRRKCDRRAIGQWSEKTTTKWTWHHFSTISIAQTPVFKASRLRQVLKQPPESLLSGDPKTSTVMDGLEAATWLKFLEQVGLQNMDPATYGTRSTLADYLPGDILAVPAYGEVGLIVTLAVAAGAYPWKTDPQSQYPIILGRDFQFEFRQHPSLGTIGAFSKYSGSRSAGDEEPATEDAATEQQQQEQQQEQQPRDQEVDPAASLAEQLADAFQHAEGDIRIGTHLALDGSVSLDGVLDRAQSTINVISQPEPSGVLKAIHGAGRCRRVPLCHAVALYEREDGHGLMWLLLADTPRRVPRIFPTAASRRPRALSALALNSSFWSRRRHVRLNENNPSVVPAGQAVWRKSDLPQYVRAHDLEYVSDLLLPPGQRARRASSSSSRTNVVLDPEVLDDPDKLAGLDHVFQACLMLLYDFGDFRRWFGDMYWLRQEVFRVLVLLQLQQVDQWLRRKGRQHVACKTTSLYMTTLAFLDADRAITENHFGFHPTVEGGDGWSSVRETEYDVKLDLVDRHSKTLRTLGILVEEIDRGISGVPAVPAGQTAAEPAGGPQDRAATAGDTAAQQGTIPAREATAVPVEPVEEREVRMFKKFENQLVCLAGRYPLLWSLSHRRGGTKVVKKVVGQVRKITKSCLEISKDTEPEGGESRTEEEIIGDVLIWRAILIALLFGAAQDNSSLFGSGLWRHVIPII